MKPFFKSACGVVAALALSSLATAGGDRPSQDRAARSRRPADGQVYKGTIVPHWEPDGSHLWYRNDLAGGKREFVRVDVARGRRAPAFDHRAVAASLARALGKPVAADSLAIERLVFEEGGDHFSFDSNGRRWAYEGPDVALRDAGKALPPHPLPELAFPHPTLHTGPSTFITFANRGRTPAKLTWISPSGESQGYGEVDPGQERKQQTFEGHVWQVETPDEEPLGVYEATDDEGLVVVDATAEARRGRHRGFSPRPSTPRAKSPDGKWTAMVRNHNVVVRREDGETFPLSLDGRPDDSYRGEFYWSPDSRWLVALKRREVAPRSIHLIESSPKERVEPVLHTMPYNKPGDPISTTKPRLFDLSNHEEVRIDEALFPQPWELDEFRWEPGSKRFTFLYNERGHQRLRIVAVGVEGTSPTAVVDERSRTFIDYHAKKFTFYDDRAGEILWMSERDGWNHLYLYDATTGRVKNRVTSGEWAVRGVERVDPATRQVWFRAGGIRPGQDPYFNHWCRVNFDGSGLVICTDGDGDHSVQFSPDGRFFLDTYSRVDLPPVTELRRSSDGSLVVPLETADVSALVESGWRAPEPFVAKGRDGVTPIYGVIHRPSAFDPDRKYPVIESIYAGPQSAYVPKSFHPSYSEQRLADLGFVVVQIDGMGTSHRSKAFHDVCWKNLGDAGLPDRIAWLKAARATRPFMDLDRVGIYGGSAGGQNALRALLAFPDFYKVGVADCGCHDNRMDKIWWNELWMGWPVGPHYASQSNVTNAHKLRGKLLLIVGELDRNVDPASTMQVVDALVKADKDFDLLIIPGAGHGAAGSPYGTRRLRDFFVRHLLGKEPRDDP